MMNAFWQNVWLSNEMNNHLLKKKKQSIIENSYG